MRAVSARTWLFLLAGAATAVGPGPGHAAAVTTFERISLQHGLSQSIIEGILQDRKGFLWFATEDGLNRYDGYRFRVFRQVAGDTGSLSHNEVKALFEDRAGSIWAGTFGGGLDRFDPATGKFTRYRHDPRDPASLGSDIVRCIREDRSGALWVGTQGGGLDRMDPRTGSFTHLRPEPGNPASLSHDDVRAIHEDRSGILWVGTRGGGLNRLDPGTRTFTRFRADPSDPRSLSHDVVTCIDEDPSGTLWVGTFGGGLNAFDPSTGGFVRTRASATLPGALRSDRVMALATDHAGTLWVATDGGGLAAFDRTAGTFTTYRNEPVDPLSISADRVWSVLEDRSNVLWVGTYGGGLNKLDVGRKRFRLFRNEPGNPDSLSQNIVWAIREDGDGNLWVGTDSGGLNLFERQTGRVRHFRHDPADPSSLAHDAVRVVFEDRSGGLWIGTNGGGLDRLDRIDGKPWRFAHHRHDPSDPASLGHDEIRTIYEDRAGELWIGTYGGGLDRWDRPTGRFVHHRHREGDPGSLGSDFVRSVYEDSQGNFWVGTHGGGLNRLDRATGRFTAYRNDPADPASLSNDYVMAVGEDRSGALWVATFGGGLNRFDRQAGTFRRFTETDGLASDSLYGFLEDERGLLWISSTRGLSCFDPRSLGIHNYDARDGLQSNEFNGGSFFRSAKGELFFGGIGGFNAFFPAEIGANPRVPPVVITDVQLFNRSVRVGEARRRGPLLTRPIEATEEIELSWKENVVTFEFAALHFAAPEKNRYAYRLEGFDDAWISARADRRSATFTGLAPGRYVFQVKGANPDGVWNEAGASLRITVLPPFWATWWFRIAGTLGAGGLAFLAVRRRVANVRLAAELGAAHDAQMALLPRSDPVFEGFEISGVCLPASEVGGDFFDAFPVDGDDAELRLVVGDVSGKGTRAAMAAAMSSGMVHARSAGGSPLSEVLTSVNRSISHKIERRMFTAMCLASIDRRTRTLTFANAGLCEPVLRSGGTASFLPSPPPAFPLGSFPETAYASATVRLAAGDVVVFTTDGVAEAFDREGAQYGYDALLSFVRGLETGRLSAAGIRDALIAEVRRFSAGSRLRDDVTVLVVKAL